ncbi:MAG: DEAD/DEAH box helicase [Actinobacteria bacterium]|nr:DEAD/DEAH box helicase [Actinomycetota bacterium]
MSVFLKRYLAEKINSQKMAGSLSRISSVLAKSTIDLNPHQIQAALYAFNSPLSRGAILADEVGLGKTIEAGIIISQLWVEGKKKILIICPASLRKQWQDELITKFGLESEVWDGLSFLEKVNNGEKIPLTYDGIFIISYQFAYKHLGLIEKQKWAVVIIDEAHRFRRVYRGRDASKMAYEIREVIKDKPKVLLTATPLQNNLEEIYGISSFIDDKLLGTLYSFKTRFVEPIKQQSKKSEICLDELRNLLRGEENNDGFSVTGIITRTLRKQVLEYVPFTDRTSTTFDFTPSDEEYELYEKVSAYLQRPEVAAIVSTQRNLMILVYRKLLASSSFAIAATIKKLIENLKEELQIREQLNSKSINTESILDEGLEEEFEEAELEGIENSISKEKRKIDKKYSDEFIEIEIRELESYYMLASKITENTKGEKLIFALKELFYQAKLKKWPEKAVIFTESTRTQAYLASILKEAELTFTIFNGSNNSRESKKVFEVWKKKFPEAASIGSASANMRQALINDFKDNTEILLTTEAGAEGLNLQFCNIVINYDLPWNPQRIEQRIGRCHRYGQRLQVIVANFLNTRNHADRRVLELLQEKLNLFDGLFGSSDEILGALESGFDFEKKILEIYQSCRTPEEYDIAFSELQDRLKETISVKTLEYRKILLENTDQSVANLFKKTDFETKQILSDFDNDLLRLCILWIGSKLKPTPDNSIFILEGYEFPIAFRELKESEFGKISRAHKNHAVIEDIINRSLNLQTKPIPSITIHLSSNPGKVFQLDEMVGKEGFIFLWKLIIEGVEVEEIVVPLTFLKQDDKYNSISHELSEKLLTIQAVENKMTFNSSPIKKNELICVWEEWKKPVLEKYQKRNERLFDRETDRVNRYYDDYALRVEDRIKKLEAERFEINRRRDNSADLEERRKFLKRLQNITRSMDKLQIEQIKLKQEASNLREKELDELWEKLELKINEELVAVTHFHTI